MFLVFGGSYIRLAFLPEKANVVFMGGVGLGKSHLASALGYAACLVGHSVLIGAVCVSWMNRSLSGLLG
jgi:DNA replication protein DnaC